MLFFFYRSGIALHRAAASHPAGYIAGRLPANECSIVIGLVRRTGHQRIGKPRPQPPQSIELFAAPGRKRQHAATYGNKGGAPPGNRRHSRQYLLKREVSARKDKAPADRLIGSGQQHHRPSHIPYVDISFDSGRISYYAPRSQRFNQQSLPLFQSVSPRMIAGLTITVRKPRKAMRRTALSA